MAVVPMVVVVEGRTYLDGVDLTPTDLYRMLAAGSGVPTTSAPAPDAYVSAMTSAANIAEAALCITVSRSFSTSLDSARLAADRVMTDSPGFEVWVLDSGSAAGGEGLVALAAQGAAASGAALDEVVTVAQTAAGRVRLVAFVDTLRYLWKGGRVPGIAHEMTRLLRLKPVFEMTRGRVSRRLPSRTSRRALQRLVDMVAKDARGPLRACVMHAGAPGEAAELEVALRESVDCDDLYIAEFSPVMGAHTGPGTLGIAFLPV
jgi:DegV family protein with EDD domain